MKNIRSTTIKQTDFPSKVSKVRTGTRLTGKISTYQRDKEQHREQVKAGRFGNKYQVQIAQTL